VVNNWRGWRKNTASGNAASLATFQNAAATSSSNGAAAAIFSRRQQSEGARSGADVIDTSGGKRAILTRN
jgi:hypothetical protein